MMSKENGIWQCTGCDFKSQYKSRLWEHIEAVHVKTDVYECTICHKISPSYNAFKKHKSRYHKK